MDVKFWWIKSPKMEDWAWEQEGWRKGKKQAEAQVKVFCGKGCNSDGEVEPKVQKLEWG